MISLTRLALLVLALAGAVGLALSNPTMDDYVRFAGLEFNRVLDQVEERSGSSDQQLIRAIVRSQSKYVLEEIVRPSTIRKNWGLVSRYETQIAGITVVVIGIGGRFIPISGFEEAMLKIRRMAF